jgi:hypothetical protein
MTSSHSHTFNQTHPKSRSSDDTSTSSGMDGGSLLQMAFFQCSDLGFRHDGQPPQEQLEDGDAETPDVYIALDDVP